MNTQLRNPGKVAIQARWHRSHGNSALADMLGEELRSAGRCQHCGKGLTDPESVQRGYGPECWAKLAPAITEPEPDIFAELAHLVERARQDVLPAISDPYVHGFISARIDRLARDIEFLDGETRRYRQ